MKYKDHEILENAYSKILLRENANEMTDDISSHFNAIADELKNASVRSDERFLNLKKIKETGKVNDFINFLNESENWVSKDNLIKSLFFYYTYES